MLEKILIAYITILIACIAAVVIATAWVIILTSESDSDVDSISDATPFPRLIAEPSHAPGGPDEEDEEDPYLDDGFQVSARSTSCDYQEILRGVG